MAANLEILITAKDSASQVLGGLTGNIMKHHKAIGAGMTALGGIIAAGGIMSLKAFAEEEKGIARLSVAMRNMGLNYEAVEKSLESWINTQQQKTAISDSEQRDALSQLIRMTGDLEKAQNLLTLAMDVSVGTGKDLASANQMVMYALGGNWGMVERYIPALKEAASEEEKWAMMQRLFAGQAEEYGKTTAGAMQLIQNNMGDLAETIGGVLAPALKMVTDFLIPIIENIKRWTAENPALTKGLIALSGALGGLLLVGGPLVIMLPTLATGFHMVAGGIVAIRAAGLAATVTLFAKLAAVVGSLGFLLVATDTRMKDTTERIENLKRGVAFYTEELSKMEAAQQTATKRYEQFTHFLKLATDELGELEGAIEDVGEVTPAVTNLATTLDPELAEAIEAANKAMNGFRITTDRAEASMKSILGPLSAIGELAQQEEAMGFTLMSEGLEKLAQQLAAGIISFDEWEKGIEFWSRNASRFIDRELVTGALRDLNNALLVGEINWQQYAEGAKMAIEGILDALEKLKDAEIVTAGVPTGTPEQQLSAMIEALNAWGRGETVSPEIGAAKVTPSPAEIVLRIEGGGFLQDFEFTQEQLDALGYAIGQEVGRQTRIRSK